MSTDYQFTDGEDVLAKRQRQLDALRSPYKGRLTVQHLDAARVMRAPEVLAVQRAAAKVAKAEESLGRAKRGRDEMIRDALRHGWSLRAVADMADLPFKVVDNIKDKKT